MGALGFRGLWDLGVFGTLGVWGLGLPPVLPASLERSIRESPFSNLFFLLHEVLSPSERPDMHSSTFL